MPLLVLIPVLVKPVVPKLIGQLADVEFNEEADVVIVMDGLAWVFEMVDVEEITGATAFATGATTTASPVAKSNIAVPIEINFLIMM